VQPTDKFVPHYYRLESHLREGIRSGTLRPGDPIPPESHLSQKFGVSRTTVRQALSRLVYEGLITRQRGRGSFVTEPRLEHTLPFMSFEEEMQARGAKAAVKFLDLRTEPVGGKAAEALRLPEGTPVTVLERQRLVDGQVVGYEIRYFPREIGEALTPEEIQTQPMVAAVRRIVGRSRARLILRVTASTARRREARTLGTQVGAPVLVRENTWYVDPDRVVQYGKSIYRGDRFQMVVEYSASPVSVSTAG
jgi:GntR family transcriptional regulator